MKTRIKCIALVLAVILTFPGLLSSSISVRANTPPVITAPSLSVPPQTSAVMDTPTTTQATFPSSSPETTFVTQTTTPPSTTIPSFSVPTESVTAPTTPSTPQPSTPPSSPLTASHAFIYNLTSDSFLFLKGTMEERIFPASITKLLTAYVALQYLDSQQQIIVGSAIYTVPPDSSLAFLAVGDVLTVEALIHGMLLPSGGDAARVIAVEAGRIISGKNDISDYDAIAVFMEEVNRQAATLGMTGTHFVTPDGFHDPDHYTTMADLLLLAKLSLEHPLIRKIASTTEYTVILSGKTRTWRNTNMLLYKSTQHPEFYRDTAIGLKTGFTGAAGRCLLSAFIVNGEMIISGVFGCPDPNWGYIAQFENTCYLYDTYIVP